MTSKTYLLGKPTIKRLRKIAVTYPQDILDESGLPSYTSGFLPYRWLLSHRLNILLSKLPAGADKKILDFGCGTGILLVEISKRYRKVIGVDLNVDLAREYLQLNNISNVRLICNKEVPVLDVAGEGNFDAIVCAQVLEHLEPKIIAETMQSLKKLLVPGGTFIVSLPTENLLYRIGRAIVGFSGDYHRASWQDVLNAIGTAGLHLIEHISVFRVFTFYKLFVFFKA